MLGFVSTITAESVLKNGIFAEIIRFLVCIYRFTQLQIYFQDPVIINHFHSDKQFCGLRHPSPDPDLTLFAEFHIFL